MKFNKMKSFVAMLIVTIMFGILTSCTQSKHDDKVLEPVELKILFFGDKPKCLDELLAEFEKRSKDDLNTKLNIEFTHINEYKQKVKLLIASKTEIDAVFDAPWVNMYSMVEQNAYLPLEQYFLNDKYPGLKKAFSADVINSNKVLGHLYGIPCVDSYGTPVYGSITLRKDLRIKYGLPPIKSNEELETFFNKVQENEKDMIPMAVMRRRGFYDVFSNKVEKEKANIFPVPVASSSGLDFEVAISKDNKTVLGAVSVAGNISYGGMYGGDSQEYYRNFPEPFNRPDLYKIQMVKKFSKYLEANASMQNDPGNLFNTGKAAAYQNFLYDNRELRKNIPDGDVEVYISVRDKDQLERKPGAVPSDFMAWNFLCIPEKSKNVERTMRFMDWIYRDRENYELFRYGIEGKHWVAVGQNELKPAENSDKNTVFDFPSYEIVGSPAMGTRLNTDMTPEDKEYAKYALRQDTYWKIPTAGFVFNQTPVKDEITKLATLYEAILTPLQFGLLDDPVNKVKEVNEKAKNVGLDKVREEIIKQMQEFLDEKNRN